MRIYLVRHGEAKAETDDPARPLTDRGRADVERVARLAAGRGATVAEIRHSGLLRARQTAEILSSCLGPARVVREVDGLRPTDDPEIARAECELATEPVMLVGHLPHLGRLAGTLVRGHPDREPVELAPGAMLCLSRSERGWEIEWLID